MPLVINNMLGRSDGLLSLLCLTLLFLLSSPKTLSFFPRPPNLSQKNDDLGLVHRWIVMKFEHHFCNPNMSILTVGNIMSELREIPLAL